MGTKNLIFNNLVDFSKKSKILEKNEEFYHIEKWRIDRNSKSLQIILNSYLRLAVSYAKKYKSYGLPLDDLIHEGVLGIMHALEKFDISKDFRLSTYASWWIRASIQDYILKNWSVVKTGSTASQKALFFNLRKIKNDGFEIERINNYVLPFQLKNHKITTLTELIINISNQFNTKEKSKKTYLAIHSDDYQLQMTCLTSKGKSNKLFEKNLIQILKRSYNLNDEHSIYDFIPQKGLEKNAIVCLSNKRDQIKKDYNELIDSGLQPRYNTSIPQILNNIHSYYNLHHKDEYSLLMYLSLIHI